MRHPLLISLLLIGLALGGAQLAWPVSYDFTTIDVPHSVTTSALGINNQGEIVGGYSDASFINHGFLLSRGTCSGLQTV